MAMLPRRASLKQIVQNDDIQRFNPPENLIGQRNVLGIGFDLENENRSIQSDLAMRRQELLECRASYFQDSRSVSR